uniref:PI3K/PI4K catalytic domain-containing protein n=1 Tax=Aplanochytrium stocchinoi TaxID=215587 RepID=A0A7S3V1P0_9STRA
MDLVLENPSQQGRSEKEVESDKNATENNAKEKTMLMLKHRNSNSSTSGSLTVERKQKCFTIMFKAGDDLRQDQLVLQMIGVMDSMFKNVNLDLNLTLYRVLATSTSEGMMEFVTDGSAVSKVLAQYGTTRNFFRKHCPWPPRRGKLSDVRVLSKSESQVPATTGSHSKDSGLVHRETRNSHMMIGNTSKSGAGAVVAEAQRDGIDPSCLSRFIKSCAGYCVISYIIGIGDRHLDNIMIKPTGELFHIDFGFIFGRDPKAWATPIRLTKEMIDTMGGRESAGYQRFKSHCCQAFKVLRNNASLILNLFHLMKDAGIPDLSVNQDYNTVLLKMKNRFMLDRSDEQAETQLLNLIDQSADALAPVIYDMFHRAATAIK